MRSYTGPRARCRQSSGDTATAREETSESIPTRILDKLGPAPGPDIDLSVQYLLNCGIANETETHPHKLSCHGGNSLYAYDYIHSTLGFIPEDSCLNYIACSSDSDEGWCPEVRSLTTCAAWNVCRTCDKFQHGKGGLSHGEEETDEYGCRAVQAGSIPNVTILEFGSIEPHNIHAIQSEIYAR